MLIKWLASDSAAFESLQKLLQKHYSEDRGSRKNVLSPLLLTLLTHDGVPTYNTNYIVFAGDTTVVDFITNEKVSQLVQWCKDNNFFS